MHGLENDFVVVDEPFTAAPDLVVALCDRRRGVGADGLLAVGVRGERVTMRYWNADGSDAEMCGNGLRCVARYAVERGLVDGAQMVVDTPVGPRRALVSADTVEVELGPVTLGDVVAVDGSDYLTASVGNPHAVAFVDDPALVDVAAVGRRVETDRLFPAGTNVEFVSVIGPDAIRLRVWERGVGETRACGTGMAAAAMAALPRLSTDQVTVEVLGGVGRVRFEETVAWLSGPATTVFAAEVDATSLSAPS